MGAGGRTLKHAGRGDRKDLSICWGGATSKYFFFSRGITFFVSSFLKRNPFSGFAAAKERRRRRRGILRKRHGSYYSLFSNRIEQCSHFFYFLLKKLAILSSSMKDPLRCSCLVGEETSTLSVGLSTLE